MTDRPQERAWAWLRIQRGGVHVHLTFCFLEVRRVTRGLDLCLIGPWIGKDGVTLVHRLFGAEAAGEESNVLNGPDPCNTRGSATTTSPVRRWMHLRGRSLNAWMPAHNARTLHRGLTGHNHVDDAGTGAALRETGH